MDLLALAVLGLLAVAGATALSSRLGVAAPLLLVVAGIAVSLLPFVPELEVDPEWILAGVLPPLLYSAAVSMPAMDFRREFPAIGGLSVLLVVVTSVVLGAFLSWVVPGLSLWWGIAIGAVISPTDAVATSIVKQVGVSGRVVSILEGESLLNDATALVLLRTAVAGASASVTLGGALGDFAQAVAVAVVLGFVVGKVNLRVRERVADPTVNTVLSFTVPFLAAVPAEALGGSGLVAAVVAGLVTGHGAPRRLTPRHRLSDAENWRTVELVLEGAVFLVLGLELTALVGDVVASEAGVGTAVLLAAAALAITVLVRAGYVAPLLWSLHTRSRRAEGLKPRLADLQERLDARVAGAALDEPATGRPRRRGRRSGTGERRRRGDLPLSASRLQRFQTRITRSAADIDYLLAAPLGWREGSVVVWAGMRGAVTVAAAQTLPPETPARSLLVLVAFLVAVGSLLLQGGTLGRLVRRVTPSGPVDDAAEREERTRVLELMSGAAASVLGEEKRPVPDADPARRQAFVRQRLAVLEAQRQAVLDARDDGLFGAETLQAALAVLDADQISLELRGRPVDG
ncbi:cation:proton antiporter [Microlunatus capsulatus]|uniref:CPA1 family monovalent cation:H+ antiporter n=1 Tax=Microlunatus capsulatus TaxID=99117 RepID=A0ABS4ZB70_9ACTN|nr:cation:proton antiporter [Microlunatus capsulatus]MBP2418005.1 CPA1 family monovalent cation:H+ antiporter [Microlunatus capsulatus]